MAEYKVTPEILRAFGLPEDAESRRMEGGHINDTYGVDAPHGRFVLQHINRFVFPSPVDVMENIIGVTEFIRDKLIKTGGDTERGTLTVIKTVDGEGVFLDSDGEYWRCTLLIENAFAKETPDTLEMLYEAGHAFGEFQSMLSDYPAETLHEIIPKFHDTVNRFAQLDEAVKNNKAGRLGEVKKELEFAEKYRKTAATLMEMLSRGELPLRVTHNDTKMSNILIDNDTGKAVCVIDLDTVMPGLTAFDFGDSVRAGASTAAEDEADLTKVNFDIDKFEAYTRGFLTAAGKALTENELGTLALGSLLMTFEVGIRFLADYLNGDVYFRTAYPEHNLVRARNQFKLVADMDAQMENMNAIVKKYA